MKRALIPLLAIASVSCGELSRQGTSPAYVVVTLLEAASGADDGKFGGTLSSDVSTMVDAEGGGKKEVVFGDSARVDFQLLLKDPGPPGAPASPSPNNYVTFDRYRVQYVRADGRNTPGVDVPFAFDGAATVTVADTARIGFTIVRVQSKLEAPLSALRANGGFIATLAEVTFYGRDQTGREVITVGRISINFANFGDPE